MDFHFEIIKLAIQERVDIRFISDRDYQKDHIVHTASARFALGNQIRIAKSEKTENIGYVAVPVDSVLNYVRCTIVKFCPTLEFGWLVPEFTQVSQGQNSFIHEEYRNIYPVAYEARNPFTLRLMSRLRLLFWETARTQLDYGYMPARTISRLEANAWIEGHLGGLPKIYRYLVEIVRKEKGKI